MTAEGKAHSAPQGSSLPAFAPTTVGEYTLLTKLASGGMATVYVGRKSGAAGFERLVAIKCCHPHLRENEDFVSMFLDEARLAAGIRHPNVVGTLDVSVGDPLYLVMEYIEGASLANLVKKTSREEQRIPPAIALRIAIDTLHGLQAAHELRDGNGTFLNLVHRDVSPQNILVGVDGISRITDFGIAFASARATQTQDGLIKGKFAYIAPEQIKGKTVTRRFDIFSAGVVLWEALTGRALFRRKDDAATIQAVLSAPVAPPSGLVDDLPEGLDEVLLRALSRNDELRYQTAAEFAEALEHLDFAAPARVVGSYLKEQFAAELSARREVIRSAPDSRQGWLPESQSQLKASGERPALPESYSQLKASGERSAPGVNSSQLSASGVVDLSKVREITTTPEGDVEHRRMRGILAALMLLLVGSAIGLLMARSAGRTQPAPTIAPSASAPGSH